MSAAAEHCSSASIGQTPAAAQATASWVTSRCRSTTKSVAARSLRAGSPVLLRASGRRCSRSMTEPAGELLLNNDSDVDAFDRRAESYETRYRGRFHAAVDESVTALVL